MSNAYPTLQALHEAYASEPERISTPWNYWSERYLADGSFEVSIAWADGTSEVWKKKTAGPVMILQL